MERYCISSISRWKTCLNDLEMKTAISYMFVKRYMPDDVIHEVKSDLH